MEPEGSLPHSQEPATCPYPEHVLHRHQYLMEKVLVNVSDITHVKSLSKIYTLHLSYRIVAFTRPWQKKRKFITEYMLLIFKTPVKVISSNLIP